VTKQVKAGLGVLALMAALLVASLALAATSKPAITGFTPSTAKSGATVTITGKNLSGATAVTIGGLKASSFKVVSATKITVKLPSNAKAGKIVVKTKGGTATSSSSLKI